MHHGILLAGIENMGHWPWPSMSFWLRILGNFGLSTQLVTDLGWNHQICTKHTSWDILGLTIGVIDLDLQGHFGHFDLKFRKFSLSVGNLSFLCDNSQCGKLNFWSTYLKTDDPYMFFTKFHLPWSNFYSSSSECTRIGEQASVSFPHWLVTKLDWNHQICTKHASWILTDGIENRGHWPWPSKSFWPRFWLRRKIGLSAQ